MPEATLALTHDFVGNPDLVQLLQRLLADESGGDEDLVVLLEHPAELGVVAVHADFHGRSWLEVGG